jgi:hypothetical protein
VASALLKLCGASTTEVFAVTEPRSRYSAVLPPFTHVTAHAQVLNWPSFPFALSHLVCPTPKADVRRPGGHDPEETSGPVGDRNAATTATSCTMVPYFGSMSSAAPTSLLG